MKKLILPILALILNQSAHAASFQCSGTEPFWSISTSKTKLTFSGAELPQKETLTIRSIQQAAGMVENTAVVIKTKNTTLTIVNGSCNDGMSEESYSHHAVFVRDHVVFYGCCNLK